MVFSLWIITIYLHFIVVGIYSNLFFRNTRQFYYNLNFLVCCRYLRQRLSFRQNCRYRLASSSTLSIFTVYERNQNKQFSSILKKMINNKSREFWYSSVYMNLQ